MWRFVVFVAFFCACAPQPWEHVGPSVSKKIVKEVPALHSEDDGVILDATGKVEGLFVMFITRKELTTTEYRDLVKKIAEEMVLKANKDLAVNAQLANGPLGPEDVNVSIAVFPKAGRVPGTTVALVSLKKGFLSFYTTKPNGDLKLTVPLSQEVVFER